MEVNEKLRDARRKKGLSQYELADRTKILNQSQISKIESGERRVTVSDIKALSLAMEIPVEFFIKESVKQTPIGYEDNNSASPCKRSFVVTLQLPENVEIQSKVQAVSEQEAIGKALEIIPTATYENIIEIKEDI